MKFRALILIFAFAATAAVSCDKDDDDDLLSQTEFKISEIKTLVNEDKLPYSDDWTITDADLYTTSSHDDYIEDLLELAADNGRTINLTLSNVTIIRAEFLTDVKEGLGNLSLPNVTDLRYRALFGTYIDDTLYLTTEDDFSTKYIDEDEDGYAEDENGDGIWFDGISSGAFGNINFDDITLVLNENKLGKEIENLTDRGWKEISYQ